MAHFPSVQIETETPLSILEASEEPEELTHAELADAFSRVLGWLLEGKTFSNVGYRVFILGHKIRPDLVGGRTLDSISKTLGHGRSSAHKLSKELSQQFQLHGMHDRSEEARRKYQLAWKRAHSAA